MTLDADRGANSKLNHAAKVVTAYLSRNHLAIDDVSVAIETIYRSLAGLSTKQSAQSEKTPVNPNWFKDYRQTHKALSERRKDKSGPLKLDRHKDFILGLIDKNPAITLAELSARIDTECNVYASISTVKHFLDRQGLSLVERRKMLAGPRLSPATAKMIEELQGVPGGLTREELAERISVSLTSSFLNTSIRKLINLGLIVYEEGRIKLKLD